MNHPVGIFMICLYKGTIKIFCSLVLFLSQYISDASICKWTVYWGQIKTIGYLTKIFKEPDIQWMHL